MIIIHNDTIYILISDIFFKKLQTTSHEYWYQHYYSYTFNIIVCRNINNKYWPCQQPWKPQFGKHLDWSNGNRICLVQTINPNPANGGSDDDHDGLLGERITSAIGYTAVQFIQFPWENVWDFSGGPTTSSVFSWPFPDRWAWKCKLTITLNF